MKIFAVAAVVLFAFSRPALAGTFDGRWSDNPKSCDPDFVVEVKENVWGSNHGMCTVISQTGSKLVFSCYIEEVQSTQVAESVTLAGDILTVVEDGTTTTYTRCPDQK